MLCKPDYIRLILSLARASFGVEYGHMAVNRKLSKVEQIIEYLCQISISLQNISKNIGHEMGPMKPQKMWNPSEEAEERNKEWEAAKAREDEIRELRESNNIAMLTAKYAAFGLFASVFLGIAQLMFSAWQHEDLKQNPPEKIIVIQEKEIPVMEVATDSAQIEN